MPFQKKVNSESMHGAPGSALGFCYWKLTQTTVIVIHFVKPADSRTKWEREFTGKDRLSHTFKMTTLTKHIAIQMHCKKCKS